MTGFLLIDKPQDWTSHDIVAKLRSITGIKKIGHSGTLDPFATGLLIIAISREATKQISSIQKQDKIYTAQITLGGISDTQDCTGTITEQSIDHIPTLENIKSIIATFIGPQQQIPPMYSAKKVAGKKLYDLARQGITIERQPNDITIYSIDITGYEYPHITITVSCSTGTYIRTLCHDIGQILGTGGYCSELRRTNIGEFSIEDAVSIEGLTKEIIEERLLSANLLTNDK